MEFTNLIDKKILFFSVQTFNLEKEIVAKLNYFGASVDYYDERPSNGTLTKGVLRLKKALYKKKIKKYYEKILVEIEGESYDYLFVNRGEVLPSFFLEEFKKKQQTCFCIFYTWDSIKNNKHPLKILKYFDKKITFDYYDAKKYNLKFRPLFFLDYFSEVKVESENLIYDLLFIGTAHSDRYSLVNEITKWSSTKGLKYFTYFYVQGVFVFIFKKLFDKSFKKFKLAKMSFKSLKKSDILKLYNCSKVILDINHPNQAGLTMRTFESIGGKRKMITTNSEIKKYSFYNPNNIFVLDRDNVKIDENFFISDYQNIENITYNKLSIGGWIYSVFIDNELNDWEKQMLKK